MQAIARLAAATADAAIDIIHVDGEIPSAIGPIASTLRKASIRCAVCRSRSDTSRQARSSLIDPLRMHVPRFQAHPQLRLARQSLPGRETDPLSTATRVHTPTVDPPIVAEDYRDNYQRLAGKSLRERPVCGKGHMEQAPEQPREHPNGQEEAGTTGAPVLAIRRDVIDLPWQRLRPSAPDPQPPANLMQFLAFLLSGLVNRPYRAGNLARITEKSSKTT